MTMASIPPNSLPKSSRRALLKTSAGMLGLSLPGFLKLQSAVANENSDSAKSNTASTGSKPAKACIVVYCWGGMSHHETFDPKPDAHSEIRGEFSTIQTATTGYRVSEHIPKIAMQTEKLAIIRSIHHDQSAHGRGMYWNMTGHAPPPNPGGNIAPTRKHWPSLAAMVSKIRSTPKGVPSAIRLPYPMVDNGTLQAGEYGGWLGLQYDPIVMKTPAGKAFGGVSRSLGSEVLELGDKIDLNRIQERQNLLRSLDRHTNTQSDFGDFSHFRQLATDMLVSAKVRDAYNLQKENPKTRELYGNHIGGQSLLLARRMVEAGVPIAQVCFAAGDLNGGAGDMWDTHGDNFNRLKKNLLPVLDQGLSALLVDLETRGMLDETLVVLLTEFGRTPKVNGGAGRDHYPNVYSVALAGAGIRGGHIYGSSDGNGAYPKTNACTPADLHATIFRTLGISPRFEIKDMMGRPFPVSDGKVLPLT